MDLNFARCQLHALSPFGVYKPLTKLSYNNNYCWYFYAIQPLHHEHNTVSPL